MFSAFLSAVEKRLADPNVFFLNGDCGTRDLLPLQEKYPDRCLNIGIAENTLVSASAGLAAAGMQPIAFSIAAFLIAKGFEQIRNDAVMQNLPVVLAGSGAGLAFPTMGPTHFALEDILLLRAFDQFPIIVPSCTKQIEPALDYLLDNKKSGYIRLGWKSEQVERINPNFAYGKGNIIQEGERTALYCSGPTLELALQASLLSEQELGVRPWILEFPTVVPFDHDLCLKVAGQVDKIITLEEHCTNGGLGEIVCSSLSNKKDCPNLERMGTDHHLAYAHGTRPQLYEHFHMTPIHVLECLRSAS